MYIGLHVKYPLSLSYSTKTWIFLWGVFSRKILNIKFHEIHPVKPGCSIQAGRRTDMTRLIAAFHNFANAPKKGTYFCFSMATIVTRTLNNVSSRNKITFYTYTVYHVFSRIRKTTKSNYWLFHVSPSICPNGTTRLPLDGFSWNFVSEYFSKKKL
jgi:hypothetical protein